MFMLRSVEPFSTACPCLVIKAHVDIICACQPIVVHLLLLLILLEVFIYVIEKLLLSPVVLRPALVNIAHVVKVNG